MSGLAGAHHLKPRHSSVLIPNPQTHTSQLYQPKPNDSRYSCQHLDLQGRDVAGQHSAGHLGCAIPTRFSMVHGGLHCPRELEFRVSNNIIVYIITS